MSQLREARFSLWIVVFKTGDGLPSVFRRKEVLLRLPR